MGFELYRFEIRVESRDYYVEGDRVQCILIIELNGILKCKHLFVTAIGELLAKQQRNRQVSHFMMIPINIQQLVKSDVLTTGLYRISFDFYMTNAIYPTFQTSYGGVSYFVEAIIDKNLFSDHDKSTRADIKVKARSNIDIPSAYVIRPVASNREVVIRVFGLKVGMVRLSAHLDKTIFYCGEPIYISFHLDNRSTRSIRFLPQLIRKTTFMPVRGQALVDDKLLASNFFEICPENCSQSDIICIPMPYDAMPSIASDPLDISYFIKLFVDVTGGSEFFDSLPIFIK